jgi:hypothetical protein
MFILMCCGQKCLHDALEPAFDDGLEKHLESREEFRFPKGVRNIGTAKE